MKQRHIRAVTKQPAQAQVTNLDVILDFILFLVQAIPAIIFQKESGI